MRQLSLLLFILLISLLFVPAALAQAPTGDICIDAFEDANRNNTHDSGETELVGVNVFLEQSGSVIASLTTTPDEDCFLSLQAGDYVVNIEASEGFEAISQLSMPVTVTEGVANLPFAGLSRQTGPANVICLLIFNDENRNGVREGTEALLPGVDVNLVQNEQIVRTLVTSATDQVCFRNLDVDTYQVYIPPALNHDMISRRDSSILFEDLGNEVRLQFGALPVNPLSDEAVIADDNSITLDQDDRLLLAGVGSALVVFFMIGLGLILVGLIRN